MEFRILGPLEVVDGSGALPISGLRQRTLLALLLTRANEVVSADRLIDELWGAEPPKSAANALQYHVSQLRKIVGPDVITTREPGYVIHVASDELDLLRFERLVADAAHAPPETAVALLRDALELWRGPPLADLADEPFAQAESARLEELRLSVVEARIEADLALGRHSEVIAELEACVRAHPLREALRAQLMRALYGAHRQAEALEIYRQTRALLVEELGIEPSPALQELERAILAHDDALVQPSAAALATPVPASRPIVAVVRDERRLGDLLAIAEPLGRRPDREVILVRLLSDDDQLASANATLSKHRAELAERGVSARVAAYTSGALGDDTASLATEHDAVLVLIDAPRELPEAGRLDDDLVSILARVPCDVGVLVGSGGHAGGPVVTPFGGIEHDWSAIEIAAWFARALGTSLRLTGTRADPDAGRRDASRLLARASLLVQQVVGVETEPVLVAAGEDGVLQAADDACLLVVGLSERWRSEGLGHVRVALAARATVPTLFVRRGIRPSGVAPRETLTRFTWTLASAAPTKD